MIQIQTRNQRFTNSNAHWGQQIIGKASLAYYNKERV